MWKRTDSKECLKIDGFYSMFVDEFDKSYEFCGESHDFWECLYVTRGSAAVSGGEKIYNVSEGEIVFHKPRELHKFRVTSSSGLGVFVFSFDMRGDANEFFKNKVFSLSEKQRAIVDELITFLSGSAHFPAGVRPNYVPEGSSALYLQTVETFITSLFLSLLNEQIISSPDESNDAKTFGALVEFMRSRITSSVSVEELAKAGRISKTALKHIFARYGGMGAHKYFLKMKIATASKLLKKGMSVTEVAEKLGFSSQAYFSSAFKRECGLSPLDYAKG